MRYNEIANDSSGVGRLQSVPGNWGGHFITYVRSAAALVVPAGTGVVIPLFSVTADAV